MIHFLTGQPLWLAALFVVGFGTAISMCGPSLVRRYVTLDKLAFNNEIAGFKYTAVATLYAVLLAFVIIVAWEKFTTAQTDVVDEAGAAVTVYRLSPGLGDQAGNELRGAMTNYLKAVIADDWPAMRQSNIDGAPSAIQALNAIYAALLTFSSVERGGNAVVSEILHQLDEMTQARRARLIAAKGTVPDVIWLVLAGGAVMSIGFTFFFGTHNLRAQTLMTGLVALLITAELLIVVAIDRPFTGAVAVAPDALSAVLSDFVTIKGDSAAASLGDPLTH
ncbi:MAG TPA: DUF4239 domain-containing protein [Xanthobacteraceae bacterium]|jgi:hypothetical protein|nr:DUF4239 domain-containing protein [Xanthobacteraceae bacterium]